VWVGPFVDKVNWGGQGGAGGLWRGKAIVVLWGGTLHLSCCCVRFSQLVRDGASLQGHTQGVAGWLAGWLAGWSLPTLSG